MKKSLRGVDLTYMHWYYPFSLNLLLSSLLTLKESIKSWIRDLDFFKGRTAPSWSWQFVSFLQYGILTLSSKDTQPPVSSSLHSEKVLTLSTHIVDSAVLFERGLHLGPSWVWVYMLFLGPTSQGPFLTTHSTQDLGRGLGSALQEGWADGCLGEMEASQDREARHQSRLCFLQIV